MKLTPRLTLTLALLALVGMSSAHATTVVEVDVTDLTLTSQWVLRAQVLDVQDVDLRAEGKGLFTDVTLAVREVYRGEAVPQRYTLRLLGGQGLDGMQMRIPGMPHFARGEDVVLFLEKTAQGHIPCGLGQGVWRVTTTDDGVAWVSQATGPVHLMRRDRDGHLAEAPPALYTPARTLNDLVWDVYAAQLAAPAQP